MWSGCCFVCCSAESLQLIPGSDITYKYNACGYHYLFQGFHTKTNTKPVDTKFAVLMNDPNGCAIQPHYAYDPKTTGLSIATQSQMS